VSVDQKQLIHETPWDTLIILDACRFDVFSKLYEFYLSGSLQKVRSLASCTRDWLRLTWTEDYQDITYISCNMFMRSQIAHTTHGEHIHEYGHPERFKRVVDVWIEGLMPEHIEKYALTIPGRKVLHYNFPHKPYYGEVKTQDLRGYCANLEFVLECVVKLLPKLNGLTVITSDHGELFSEHGAYHPCSGEYQNDPRLRDVPWLFQAKPLKG